jgi:Tfp pilus assembly protein PilO
MPIILIAAAISGFFLYTNPQYQNVKAQAASYQQIVEANSKASELRAERERLTSDRARISEQNVDKLGKTLPDGVENVGLIIDIDDIAGKYGMKIKNTKVNEVSARGPSAPAVGPDSTKYGVISLTFGVTTTYDNFLAFLRDLESSERLVDVTDVSFSSNRAELYDITITIQTYWLK